ncbi:hypothetical protein D3C79_957320 [compost metagenome]
MAIAHAVDFPLQVLQLRPAQLLLRQLEGFTHVELGYAAAQSRCGARADQPVMKQLVDRLASHRRRLADF